MKEVKSRRKVWFQKLILLTISICVSLLIAEVLLRAYDRYFSINEDSALKWKPTYEFIATRHHRLIPNVRSKHTTLEFDYVWENNSLGMRDHERSAKKSKGRFRILFIGDSIVQGWGVPMEQSLTTLLENSLNKPKRKETIEVLNAGVFGYSPFLEYLYLKELMPIIEFDLVIVGFFLGNDVGDDYFYTQQAKLVLQDSTFIFDNNDRWPWSDLVESTIKTPNKIQSKNFSNGITHYVSLLWNVSEPILMKSHLIRLVRKFVAQNEDRRELREQNKLMQKLINKYKDDIRINLSLINYPVLNKEQRLKYWQISKSYLASIHNLCLEQNVPVVLVVFPGGGPPDFNEPYEIIDQFALELSFSVIHLRQEILEHSSESIEYPLDGHWNSEGNRLAATVIDRKLRHLNLLPLQLSNSP